jgi:hypothetical protein
MKADLECRVALQRSAHSYYEHRSRIVSIAVTAVSIILPATIAFVAFTDVSFIKTYLPWVSQNTLKLSMGFGSLALFLLAVFDQIFQITTRHDEHRRAIELYSQLLMDIGNARLDGVPLKETRIRVEQFNHRYLQIAANTLSFTERKFARAEKSYLKMRALRQARKELVFAWPWTIRKRAKAIAQILHENEGSDKRELRQVI